MKNGIIDLYLKDVLDALGRSRHPYRKLEANGPEAKETTAWLESCFPINNWSRIEWKKVEDHTQIPWQNSPEARAAFEVLLAQRRLHDQPVIVMWSDQLMPSLELSLEAVRENFEEIIETDFDTWIVPSDRSWCIENYHEGELTFGRPQNDESP